jgi:hypothetical protein
MRVGDILLSHQWVDWESLALAIGDQRGTDVRIVSLLVARKLVTFEHGALALAEQHGTAAVLQRHLDMREQSAASLLPMELMRTFVVLPLGFKGDGTLIICARDPNPALRARIAKFVQSPFELAVTVASALERALIDALQRRAADEVDISIDAGTSGEIDIDLDASNSGEFAVDIAVSTTPVAASKPLPVRIERKARITVPPASTSLEGVIKSLTDIDDVAWMLDVVQTYLRTHWLSHIVKAAADVPALARACEGKRVILDAAVGAVLADLGNPDRAAAAPVLRGDQIAYVIAVGAPRTGDADDAAAELAALAEALGEALLRIG